MTAGSTVAQFAANAEKQLRCGRPGTPGRQGARRRCSVSGKGAAASRRARQADHSLDIGQAEAEAQAVEVRAISSSNGNS